MQNWTLLAALYCLIPAVSWAQLPSSLPEVHGSQEHPPLEVDESLEWHFVLQRAVTHYPRYVELEARRTEADALARRGRSLFANRPELMLGYRSDDPLDDFGFAEYEAGVSLPLWRFGERRAAGRMGASATEEAAAAGAALQWEVAGVLREILWNIEDARHALGLSRDAVELATEIERVVSRRHEVGDLPLEDVLLAEAAALERRSALLEAEAELVDAEFAYRLLTELDARPPPRVELLTEPQSFSESHPLLRLSAAAVERARAELALASRESKGSPVLTIGPRRQRDPLTDFYFDSIGAEVAVPFGGDAHRRVAVAASQRRAAEAEAEHATLERQLHAALHEAQHSLQIAERGLALAARRAEIAARHQSMGETAFEQGEVSLVELLRRIEAARLAARDARAYEVLRARSIASVNQALGELP